MALVSKLKSQYRVQAPDKAVALFIGCTDQNHTGNNFLQRMTQEVEKVGNDMGFTEYLADCTNKISQKVLKRLGYAERAEIQYDKFNFQGKFPFRGMEDNRSIKLMSKVTKLEALKP